MLDQRKIKSRSGSNSKIGKFLIELVPFKFETTCRVIFKTKLLTDMFFSSHDVSYKNSQSSQSVAHKHYSLRWRRSISWILREVIWTVKSKMQGISRFREKRPMKFIFSFHDFFRNFQKVQSSLSLSPQDGSATELTSIRRPFHRNYHSPWSLPSKARSKADHFKLSVQTDIMRTKRIDSFNGDFFLTWWRNHQDQ